MFKSLRIKNIQSHKNTYIKFHKGVNVIVGDSDQGKSAIFNSLYWLMQNRPLGEQHRSWNGGTMLSELKMDNGTIQLKKDKQSIYTINPKTDKLVFKAFGQNPPQEVLDLLNMDKKINIQQQLERGVPIFLLSESPGDVAKFFNKVAHIDDIDIATKAGKKDLKDTEGDHKTAKQMIKDKKKELKAYDGIEVIEDKVLDALKLEKKINKTVKEMNEISPQLNLYKATKFELKRKEIKHNILLKVKKVESVFHQRNKTSVDQWNIKHDINSTKIVKRNIKTHEQKVKLLPKIKQALLIIDKMKANNTKFDTIDGLFKGINSTIKQIEYLITKKQGLSIKFDKLMPDECPLCLQRIIK